MLQLADLHLDLFAFLEASDHMGTRPRLNWTLANWIFDNSTLDNIGGSCVLLEKSEEVAWRVEKGGGPKI